MEIEIGDLVKVKEKYREYYLQPYRLDCLMRQMVIHNSIAPVICKILPNYEILIGGVIQVIHGNWIEKAEGTI